MYPDLKDKVALITGGSRGIGLGVAELLANEGVNIAINYRRSRRDASTAVEQLNDKGIDAIAIKADVGKPDQVESMFNDIREHFGGLDILVSNAAFGQAGPLLEVKPRHWDITMNICARALLVCTQQAVPLMKQRGGGSIISMTSAGGQYVLPQYGAVGPAKAALESLTRGLAVELAADNIRVNAIMPGIVETRSMKAIPNAEDMLEDAVNDTPAGRTTSPEDVARLAAFLASDQSEMIVGDIIKVDGGQTLQILG